MALRFPLKKRLLLVLPILLLSYSCDMLTDEFGECFERISPKLPQKTMLNGKVGEDYSVTISAYVKRADEENFEYRFSKIGDLPAGLSYRSNGRVFEIFGTPTKAGTYTFKVKVELPNVISGVGDGFCFIKNYDRQKYTIIIEE